MKRYDLRDEEIELIVRARNAGVAGEVITAIFGHSTEIRKLIQNNRLIGDKPINPNDLEDHTQTLKSIVANRNVEVNRAPPPTRNDPTVTITPAVEQVVKKYLALGLTVTDISAVAKISSSILTEINKGVTVNHKLKVNSVEEAENQLEAMMKELNEKTYTHTMQTISVWPFNVQITEPYVKQWPDGKMVFINRHGVSSPYIKVLHDKYEVR